MKLFRKIDFFLRMASLNNLLGPSNQNVCTETYQLIARWLGMNELLVGVEKELTENSASHDDQAAHKIVINEHANLSFKDLNIATGETSQAITS